MGGASKESGAGQREAHGVRAALVWTNLPLPWDLGRPGPWKSEGEGQGETWKEEERERGGEDVPCARASLGVWDFCGCNYLKENPTCLYRGDSLCTSLWLSGSVCPRVWAQ